jgi:Family of unknown function (DUF6186)
MNSHDVTVLGYAAIAISGAILQLRSLRAGSRMPSLGRLLGWVMRTRSGRVGVITGWVWVGLHYFAR